MLSVQQVEENCVSANFSVVKWHLWGIYRINIKLKDKIEHDNNKNVTYLYSRSYINVAIKTTCITLVL